MTKYKTLNVKLSNSQLKNWKENEADVIFF